MNKETKEVRKIIYTQNENIKKEIVIIIFFNYETEKGNNWIEKYPRGVQQQTWTNIENQQTFRKVIWNYRAKRESNEKSKQGLRDLCGSIRGPTYALGKSQKEERDYLKK